MKYLLAVALLLWPAVARSQECQDTADAVCVDKQDLKAFLELAKERQCLDATAPKVEADSVTILTDEKGRVFYTGNDPKHPYKVRLDWCHYKITAEGKVEIVTAIKEPEVWGFRFRPKAYLGYLPVEALRTGKEFSDGVDSGVMVDFVHYEWINVNAAVGFRSLGAGLGFDLTENFGVYGGWALSWDSLLNGGPPHNLLGSIYFAF